MNTFRRYAHWPLVLFVAIIFIQSLFFKFTDAPATQHIFIGTLEPWAASLGFSGLFSAGGIFSARVIGGFELLSALLLLAGAIMRRSCVLRAGAALGLAIISGAIFFHVFTPLGIVVQNDGGELFILACLIWLSCLLLLRKV